MKDELKEKEEKIYDAIINKKQISFPQTLENKKDIIEIAFEKIEYDTDDIHFFLTKLLNKNNKYDKKFYEYFFYNFFDADSQQEWLNMLNLMTTDYDDKGNSTTSRYEFIKSVLSFPLLENFNDEMTNYIHDYNPHFFDAIKAIYPIYEIIQNNFEKYNFEALSVAPEDYETQMNAQDYFQNDYEIWNDYSELLTHCLSAYLTMGKSFEWNIYQLNNLIHPFYDLFKNEKKVYDLHLRYPAMDDDEFDAKDEILQTIMDRIDECVENKNFSINPMISRELPIKLNSGEKNETWGILSACFDKDIEK